MEIRDSIAAPSPVLIPDPQSRIPSMDPQDAIDLGREALWTTLIIGSPVLVAGMIVGLVIGLFQALTQIQEQSVAFVPKIIVMLLVLSISLPWLIAQMVQYTSDLIGGIPGRFELRRGLSQFSRRETIAPSIQNAIATKMGLSPLDRR